LLFALLLIALTASIASADGIDPTVVIRDPLGTPIPITSPNQTFTFTATSTNLDILFQNQSGVLLTSLSIVLTGTDAFGNPLDFSFGSDPGDAIFADFTKTVLGNTTTLLFFGVDPTHSGLLPAVCTSGDEFEIEEETECIGGIYDIQFAGIPVGGTVNGSATVATPEPTTLLLLSAGLIGIAGVRRRSLKPNPLA